MEDTAMTIYEFLEKDKERFLQRLSSVSGPDRVIQVCEEELNRILLQYNEANTDKRAGEEAWYAMQTARAALPLLDTAGEAKVYTLASRREDKKASARVTLPLAAGIGSSAGGALLLALGAGHIAALTLFPVSALLLIAGMGGIFLAGRRSAEGVMPQVPGETIVESETDSEKVYHSLSMMLNVVDHNLEEVRRKSALSVSESDIPGLPDQSASPLKKDELQLLSGLLESAYSRPEEAYARDMISEIRFYLHRHSVELVEYSLDTASLFDRMPAPSDRTIRPALKSGTLVLMRGLAGTL
jgi:hypothetical protein